MRITHFHMDHLNKLVCKDLVIGLPNMNFEKSWLCDAYQQGKQVRVSFNFKNVVSTNQPLQLLHMNFSQSRTKIFCGKLYALKVMDDYSLYTWR